MKRTLTAIALVLLVAGTVQAGLQTKIGELLGLDEEEASVRTEALVEPSASTTYITAWFLSAPDVGDSHNNEYKARVGVQLEDMEFGLQLDYYGLHGASPGQQYGAYVLVHLNEPFFTDLLGDQYLGFSATVVTEDVDIGSYGAIVGVLRPITDAIAFGFEYQYRSALDDFPGFDRNKFVGTLRIKF